MTGKGPIAIKTAPQKAWLVLVLACLLWPEAALGAGPVSWVHQMSGRANVFQAATKRQIPAELKLPLFLQDVVRTGVQSRMNLLFVDESILSIGQNTQLTITTYLYDPNRKARLSIIDLTWGRLRSVTSTLMQYRDSEFTVRTPTAVVGVRGSVFFVNFDYHRQFTEVVNNSRTSLVQVTLRSDPNRTTTLAPGETVQVTRFQIGPKRLVTPQYLAYLNNEFLPFTTTGRPADEGWIWTPDRPTFPTGPSPPPPPGPTYYTPRPPLPGPTYTPGSGQVTPWPRPGQSVPLRSQCPPGQFYQPRMRRCMPLVKAPPPGRSPGIQGRCPQGLFWNPRLRRCTRRVAPVRPGVWRRCPAGYRLRAGQCVPLRCRPGYVLSQGGCRRVIRPVR